MKRNALTSQVMAMLFLVALIFYVPAVSRATDDINAIGSIVPGSLDLQFRDISQSSLAISATDNSVTDKPAIIEVPEFMASDPTPTESQTTTNLSSLNYDVLQNIFNWHEDVSYFIGKEKGFSPTFNTELITWTPNSTKIVTLNVYTDFGHRIGLESKQNIIWLNNEIKKIGKGNISMPWLANLTNNWIEVWTGEGYGYNKNTNSGEGKFDVTFISHNLQTGGTSATSNTALTQVK